VKEKKEKVVLDVLIVKEMLRTKTKLDDLLERCKDLDFMHVKKKFEEYDDLEQYIQYCVPNNRWKIPMLNYMNGGNWQRHNFKKKCKGI